MTHQTTAAGEINIAGPTRILFLDMAELEETSNIEPVVCEATKHPANPILPLGYAHEFDGLAACMWGGGGSLYDAEESLFRIWYHAHGREYHPDDGAYSTAHLEYRIRLQQRRRQFCQATPGTTQVRRQQGE
jgi:hypothetical protein